jgi:hypothetical protein
MGWKQGLKIIVSGIFLLLAFISGEAKAAEVDLYCVTSPTPPYTWAPCSSSNLLQTAASVSASITGFPGTTQTTGTPISVTTGGVTGTLPAGAVVVAFNTGTTNTAYCKLGASATTSDAAISPNSWFAFTVGSNTQLTCITSTSTTTVNMVGGSGLPTGAGGGGGSGGAVTVANGADTPAVTPTSSTAATMVAISKAIANAVTSAIPAGANLIGSVVSTISGSLTNPTSTLTLPATTTAYTAGQLIANSATAGSVVVPSFAVANSAGGVYIPRLRLTTNDSTSTAWGAQTITVDLWSAAPTFTNGDRGTWSPATGTANHVAQYSCVMSAEYGDGAFSECAVTPGNLATFKLASGTAVFWTLNAKTGSGVTGASKVFTLTAELSN